MDICRLQKGEPPTQRPGITVTTLRFVAAPLASARKAEGMMRYFVLHQLRRTISPRRFLGAQLRRLGRLLFPAFQRPDLLAQHELEAGLDLLYRFILARPADEGGRRHYLRLMREQGMKLREVAAFIAASDEFQTRLQNSLGGEKDKQSEAVTQAEAFVDVRELAETLSVEELAQTAEDYYRHTIEVADRYLAKPFNDPYQAPEVLGSLAQLLGGLRLTPGMTVLDFGAGTCWMTRFLTQFGCAAIALDVSPTALQLGRELFSRVPPIGDQPAPRFLVFDGRHIDLPDASVDRVVCFDAFHHVPNPAEVMGEIGRVLRPGGIAAFSEPGPNHSKAATSQYEMKNYRAFENDVVMPDIWRWAQAAGFSGLELAIFSNESYRVSLKEFDDVTAGGGALDAYGERVRAFLTGHQTFFLRKGGAAVKDSRERDGLKGEIMVRLERPEVRDREPIRGEATVLNVGTATWLPGPTLFGGVNLGVHLRMHDGRPLNVDFARLTIEHGTVPGGSQTVSFALEPPAPGEYLLEFDLVSEAVAWFEMNGSATATVRITVR
jgi:SAM-dependent methyltransferase